MHFRYDGFHVDVTFLDGQHVHFDMVAFTLMWVFWIDLHVHDAVRTGISGVKSRLCRGCARSKPATVEGVASVKCQIVKCHNVGRTVKR